MRHGSPNRRSRVDPILVLALLTVATLAVLLLVPPVPQDQAYHLFADQRRLLGIPNFWNVVSNLPFLVVGGLGLARLRDTPAMIVLFLGFLLTGIGSSYYHLEPNDDRLFWDRLPMTLSFAAIFALVVDERVGARTGAAVLWPMLAIGVSSLLVWLWIDDLRLYFWAQFYPGLALLVLMMLYPAKYSHARYWLFAAGLYALSKCFEFADAAVYSPGHIVSGHTLKHLFAAAACFVVLRYLQFRRPIA
jgi:Ceramidase